LEGHVDFDASAVVAVRREGGSVEVDSWGRGVGGGEGDGGDVG